MTPGANPPRSKARAALLVIAVVITAGLLVLWAVILWPGAMPFGLTFSVAEAERLITSFGPWAAVASIALMILHSFVPFPAEVLAVANGMLFGPVWGTLVTWIGAMLGAYVAFGLARWLGRPFAETFVPPERLDQVDRWSEQYGAAALFFSRFMPVISFNLANYAAGVAKVPWLTFTWSTGLGILPMIITMVLAGDHLSRAELEIGLLLLGTALLLGTLALVVIRPLRGGDRRKHR